MVGKHVPWAWPRGVKHLMLLHGIWCLCMGVYTLEPFKIFCTVQTSTFTWTGSWALFVIPHYYSFLTWWVQSRTELAEDSIRCRWSHTRTCWPPPQPCSTVTCTSTHSPSRSRPRRGRARCIWCTWRLQWAIRCCSRLSHTSRSSRWAAGCSYCSSGPFS